MQSGLSIQNRLHALTPKKVQHTSSQQRYSHYTLASSNPAIKTDELMGAYHQTLLHRQMLQAGAPKEELHKKRKSATTCIVESKSIERFKNNSKSMQMLKRNIHIARRQKELLSKPRHRQHYSTSDYAAAQVEAQSEAVQRPSTSCSTFMEALNVQ